MSRYFFCGIFLAATIIPAIWVSSSCGETAIAGLNEQGSRYNDILVQEVVNADTIVLENGETVRLIGVRVSSLVSQAKQRTLV